MLASVETYSSSKFMLVCQDGKALNMLGSLDLIAAFYLGGGGG